MCENIFCKLSSCRSTSMIKTFSFLVVKSLFCHYKQIVKNHIPVVKCCSILLDWTSDKKFYYKLHFLVCSNTNLCCEAFPARARRQVFFVCKWNSVVCCVQHLYCFFWSNWVLFSPSCCLIHSRGREMSWCFASNCNYWL